MNLAENMGLEGHIDSLVEKFRSGIKALKAISGIANFATRNNILNELIKNNIYDITMGRYC